MRTASIKTIISGVLIVSSLSSCLKTNDMIGLNPAQTSNIVTFDNTGDNVASASSTYSRYATDLGAVKPGDTVAFNLNVGYEGANDAPTDIAVQIALDTAMLRLFNNENGTSYEAPPTAIYQFPTAVVIKKGTRKTQALVKIINNSSFDFNKNYGLPLAITSASAGTISYNLGKAVYSFSARNSYDGVYTMDASAPMVDMINPAFTGLYPLKMNLITYTGNSVALYDPVNIKTYGHPFSNAGSLSYYGSFSPVFFFDNTGKVTSVTNYYGQESGGNKRSAVLDPTGVNKITFTAGGKVKYIEVSYIMTQSVSSPMKPRTYFHEKFTYQSAR